MIHRMNNKKKQKKTIRIQYKILIYIFILIPIYCYQYFIFKNGNNLRKGFDSRLLPFKMVDAYSTRKDCTSSTDDSTCHEVVFGDLHIPSNSVEKLKILRGKDKIIYVTLRRDYVIVSYYLKYLKDVPNFIEEEVTTLKHYTYKKYTDEELDLFVENCFSKTPEGAKNPDPSLTSAYLKVTAGVKCFCPQYKLFNGVNAIKRTQLNCNFAKITFGGNVDVFSRHCAHMHPPYYSVYSIDYPPIFNTYVKVILQEYNLDDIEAKKKETPDLLKKEKVYVMNDSVKFVRDDYFDVTIILRDEQHGKTGIVNLSDDYILIPSAPTHFQQVEKSNIDNNCGLEPDSPLLKGCNFEAGLCDKIHPCLEYALMLPSDEFDLSGGVCNKIGISYNTWRSPPGGDFCATYAGSCLRTKLSTYNGDHFNYVYDNTPSPYKIKNVYGSEPQISMFKRNDVPDHLKSVITKEGTPYTKILDNSMIIPWTTATHPMFINYKYNGNHTVHVYFETTANDVYRINHVADGAITHITTPTDCDAKKTKSVDCMLVVHVWNSSSTEAAGFTCMVECKEKDSDTLSPELAPIEPQSANIGADKTHAFYFIIKFLTNAKSNVQCKAILLNSKKSVIFQDSFQLESKAIVKVVDKDVRVVEAAVQITKFEEEEKKEDESQTKDVGCGCGINIFCYIFNIRRCISYFIGVIMSFIGKIASIVALVFLLPVLLPFMPFIIKFCITFCILPMKILCVCLKRKRKLASGKSNKMKSEKFKRISSVGKGFFKKLKKKKKSSSSSKEISLSETTDSDDFHSYKKKTPKKKKISSDSQSSSSVSKKTVSTLSTSSVSSSLSSENTLPKKSKNFKRSKKLSESSSLSSSISLNSSSSESKHSKQKRKKKINKKK